MKNPFKSLLFILLLLPFFNVYGNLDNQYEYKCYTGNSNNGLNINITIDNKLSYSLKNPNKLAIFENNKLDLNKEYFCANKNSIININNGILTELTVNISTEINSDKLENGFKKLGNGKKYIKHFDANQDVFFATSINNDGNFTINYLMDNQLSNTVNLNKNKASRIKISGSKKDTIKKINIIISPKGFENIKLEKTAYILWGDKNYLTSGNYTVSSIVKDNLNFGDRLFKANLVKSNLGIEINKFSLFYKLFPTFKEYEVENGIIKKFDKNGNKVGYIKKEDGEENYYINYAGKDVLVEKTYFSNGKKSKILSFNPSTENTNLEVLFDNNGCFKEINSYGLNKNILSTIKISDCKINSNGKMDYKSDKYLFPGEVLSLTQFYNNGLELPEKRVEDEKFLMKTGLNILNEYGIVDVNNYEEGLTKLLEKSLIEYKKSIEKKGINNVEIYSLYSEFSEKLNTALWGLEYKFNKNLKYKPYSKGNNLGEIETKVTGNNSLILGFWITPHKTPKNGNESIYLDLSSYETVDNILSTIANGYEELKNLEKPSKGEKLNNNEVGFKNEKSFFAKITNFLLPSTYAAAGPCDGTQNEYDNCKHGGVNVNGGLHLGEVNYQGTDTNKLGGGYFMGQDSHFYFYNKFTNSGNSGYMSIEEFMKPDPTVNKLINEFLINEKIKLDAQDRDFTSVSDLELIRNFYRYFAAKNLNSYAWDYSETYQTVGETISRGNGNCGDYAMFTMNMLYNTFKKLGRNSAADNLYYSIAALYRGGDMIGGHAVVLFYNSADSKYYYIESGIIIQNRDLSGFTDEQILPTISVNGSGNTDSYSPVANWSPKIYFRVNANSEYYKIREWFIQGELNQNTIFGWTNQSKGGKNKGGLIGSISDSSTFVTPGGVNVNKLSNIINNEINNRLSARGLVKNETNILKIGNEIFSEIINYKSGGTGYNDIWISGENLLINKYGGSIPTNLGGFTSNKIEGDCDRLVFLEASILRNILGKYYDSKGFSDHFDRAKNNIVIIGTEGHLDLGYIGDYLFDDLSGILIFDYNNGKINLLKVKDYLKNNPTSNSEAVLFGSCNLVESIGTKKVNWSKYSTDLVVIAVFFPCSGIGQALFGSCGGGDGGTQSTPANAAPIDENVPQSTTLKDLDLFGTNIEICKASTRNSCPTDINQCDASTLHCGVCSCYFNPGSSSCVANTGVPPTLNNIDDLVYIKGNPYELDLTNHINKTENDPIEEVDSSFIKNTSSKGNGIFDTTIPGMYYVTEKVGENIKYKFFGTPEQAGIYESNEGFKVKDNDGWSDSKKIKITVKDGSAPICTNIGIKEIKVGQGLNLDLDSYITSPNQPILKYEVSGANIEDYGLKIEKKVSLGKESNGILSGTGTQIGTLNLTVKYTNGEGTCSSYLNLNIKADDNSPEITIPTQTGYYLEDFNLDLSNPNFIKNNGLSITDYKFTNNLASYGLNINNTTGMISGNLTKTGSINVDIEATNSAGIGKGFFKLNMEFKDATPKFFIPDQIGIEGEDFELMLPNYTVSDKGAISGYDLVSVLPTGLNLNKTTGIISGKPSVIVSDLIVKVKAKNDAGFNNGWGDGSFKISIGENVAQCEDENPQNIYNIAAGTSTTIKAKMSPKAKCFYVKNTSTNKDIRVFNQKDGDFENFQNSTWATQNSNTNLQEINYTYSNWNRLRQYGSPIIKRDYSRKCLRNGDSEVDCKYCGNVCSKTETAIYVGTTGNIGKTVYRPWAEGAGYRSNYYKIEGEPYSYSTGWCQHGNAIFGPQLIFSNKTLYVGTRKTAFPLKASR